MRDDSLTWALLAFSLLAGVILAAVAFVVIVCAVGYVP